MKKKNFLGGISAKLALSLVTLTAAMFTSCTKESFDVTTTGLPDAKGEINVTVMCGIENVTSQMTISDHAVTVNSDGTISAKDYTITATDASLQYTNASETIQFPALSKGQIYVYNVTLFVEKMSEAIGTEVTPTEPVVKTESPKQSLAAITGNGTPVSVTYDYTAGSKVENYSEIKAKIESLTSADGKRAAESFTLDQIKAGLMQQLNALNTGITTTKRTESVIVAKGETLYPTYYTIYEKSVNILSAGGYQVGGVQIEKALGTVLTLTKEGHGHGHGDDSNSGGGAGGK